MAKIRQHRLMHSVAVAVAGQYATPIRALKVLPLAPSKAKIVSGTISTIYIGEWSRPGRKFPGL